MRNWNLSKIMITLFVSGAVLMIGTATPLSAQAADQMDQSFKNKREKHHKIRGQEEKNLRSKDQFHAKHIKSLAKQYEESAKIVAKQGGDPKPLLAAAEYFRAQSKGRN